MREAWQRLPSNPGRSLASTLWLAERRALTEVRLANNLVITIIDPFLTYPYVSDPRLQMTALLLRKPQSPWARFFRDRDGDHHIWSRVAARLTPRIPRVLRAASGKIYRGGIIWECLEEAIVRIAALAIEEETPPPLPYLAELLRKTKTTSSWDGGPDPMDLCAGAGADER